jgi:hypothetical protein
MSHCLSCLCPDAGTPCRECGYAQIRHAPGARLGPLVRTTRTPLQELLRAERMHARSLAHLGALEAGEVWGAPPWSVEEWRGIVEVMAAKRDAAALSLDREVVARQLSVLPPSWRLGSTVPRDAGPAEG